MQGISYTIIGCLGLDDPALKKRFFICLGITILGFIVGASACGALDAVGNEQLLALKAGFISQTDAASFGAFFRKSLVACAIYFSLCVLSGFFAFGTVVSALTVFVRSLGCGLIAGLVCCSNGLAGFIYYIIAILPGFAVESAVFGYLAAISGSSSSACFDMFTGRGKKKERNNGVYLGYIGCAVCIILGVILESAMRFWFIGLL